MGNDPTQKIGSGSFPKWFLHINTFFRRCYGNATGGQDCQRDDDEL